MGPRNGGSARQGAPDTFTITRRKPYQPATTQLQDVLAELAGVFQHAAERLDERGFDCVVDVLTIRVAREQRLRLERRGRRAA